MKSGILIIDKEQNKTSRDVVNDICKIFHTKKVGHTGTLDPLATGVLVVAVNEGCKLIEFLTSDEKEYIAEAVIGESSDTLDVTGNIKEQKTKECTREEIEAALVSFLGTYEQEVPKFSAVHVNGKRLYEYARNEEEVKLPTRTVTIKDIKLLDLKIEEGHQVFSFQVTVSKGTYIRSLIRDIGEKLNTSCIMKNLRRTRQGNFKIEDAKKVQDIQECDIISLKNALASLKSRTIKDEQLIKRIKNGAKLPCSIEDTTCFLDEKENLLAIYVKQDNMMKPLKVFHQNLEDSQNKE